MAEQTPDVGSRLKAQGSGQWLAAERQRILVIAPSNIGDAILASDVIATLARCYPDAHVTLLIGARAKTLFVEDPRIQTIIDTNAEESLISRLKLALALWRHQPQVVVDLRHTLYPLLLKPLQCWRFMRLPPKRLRHMRDRHLWKLRRQVPEIARALAHEPAQPIPGAVVRHARADGLWYSPKDAAHIETLRKRWQLDAARPLVVIAPGARSHIKRWTVEGFARLADRLMVERNAQVVFSGEPDEKPTIEEILSLMSQRALSAVGLITVRQLGVLMQRASLVITNDSASLHLASAQDVPTVAIFGPTDAGKYGPTATQARTIRRRLFCAPCEQALCRFNHECMRFVTAAEVFEAAAELLGRRAEGGGRSL